MGQKYAKSAKEPKLVSAAGTTGDASEKRDRNGDAMSAVPVRIIQEPSRGNAREAFGSVYFTTTFVATLRPDARVSTLMRTPLGVRVHADALRIVVNGRDDFRINDSVSDCRASAAHCNRFAETAHLIGGTDRVDNLVGAACLDIKLGLGGESDYLAVFAYSPAGNIVTVIPSESAVFKNDIGGAGACSVRLAGSQSSSAPMTAS